MKRALAPWPARWKQEKPPPDCRPLLGTAEQAACATTASALLALQRSAERSPTDLLHPATDLALAARLATEALRRAGFSELLAERDETTEPRPSSDASAGPKVPYPSPSGSSDIPSALPGHHHSSRKHDNPTLSAIVAYSRLSSLALRQLAIYLELGSPDVRRRAFARLNRLAGEEPRWGELRALVREAELLEPDPTLRSDLAKLGSQLRKNRRNP